MPLKINNASTVVFCLVLLGIALSNCGQRESAVPKSSEAHLRNRVATAYDSLIGGHLDEYISMWSQRARTHMFESESEKRKVFAEMKGFLGREKPTFEPISVEISGSTATVKMRVSVLQGDGPRSFSTLYDQWVFENEDWFLNDSQRTSPEFFPKGSEKGRG